MIAEWRLAGIGEWAACTPERLRLGDWTRHDVRDFVCGLRTMQFMLAAEVLF